MNCAPIRDSGGSGPKRYSHIVEIQKYSVAWIDRLEHGLLDAEESLIAEVEVGGAGPFVWLSHKTADLRRKRHRRLDINTHAAEPVGGRDDRGCEIGIMTDGSGYTSRPDGITSGRPRYSHYGNPQFPAQGPRDVASGTACPPD